MYEIGICDDGENICSMLEEYIFEYARKQKLQIDTMIYNSGEVLRDQLSSGLHLDILLLDIELTKMTGIELGSFIRGSLKNRDLQLVYISGHESYARQLFKTQPIDFLVKPITKEQLFDTLDFTIQNIEKKMERFEFQKGKDHMVLSMGSILYFESAGRKTKIITDDETYEFYCKQNSLLAKLSDDFLEIHQSYIINKRHVQQFNYESIRLDNGIVLPISQARRAQVRKNLLKDKTICSIS